MIIKSKFIESDNEEFEKNFKLDKAHAEKYENDSIVGWDETDNSGTYKVYGHGTNYIYYLGPKDYCKRKANELNNL